jgi:hypothetical protein
MLREGEGDMSAHSIQALWLPERKPHGGSVGIYPSPRCVLVSANARLCPLRCTRWSRPEVQCAFNASPVAPSLASYRVETVAVESTVEIPDFVRVRAHRFGAGHGIGDDGSHEAAGLGHVARRVPRSEETNLPRAGSLPGACRAAPGADMEMPSASTAGKRCGRSFSLKPSVARAFPHPPQWRTVPSNAPDDESAV